MGWLILGIIFGIYAIIYHIHDDSVQEEIRAETCRGILEKYKQERKQLYIESGKYKGCIGEIVCLPENIKVKKIRMKITDKSNCMNNDNNTRVGNVVEVSYMKVEDAEKYMK